MSSSERFSIGIDIGGTFTDCVVISTNGHITTAKAPTTPDDFSVGVVAAIEAAARSLGVTTPWLLGRADVVKHGSTVATNALLTRQGARVGLITTHGFEDTPFIMRAVGRVDGLPEEEVQAAPKVTKPEPLVAPELVRGVRERIDVRGDVVIPLNEADVERAVVDLLEVEDVDAIAVSLLNAWRNPLHEHRIRDRIEAHPCGRSCFVSLGGELSGLAGEYARTNTAIVNAFVGPPVASYIARLRERLAGLGFNGRLLAMQGNGGVSGQPAPPPISTLQSGPAGGMLAARYVAEQLGHRHVLTTDMGGTSFDVGVIEEGRWRYAEEPVFERFRILQPTTDVTSIGAGGGTIARVHETTGRLLVGPQSAGAVPGPVCYGLGGSEPTVTDADLVLGYLDPAYFLGGRRRLDAGAAEAAIRARIAEPLGLTTLEAAAGIVRVVTSKMADLIRREVVRRGRRPEDFVLYAFGGAGPTHAVGYARELGISQVLVFPSSSVFSAFGIATADVVHTRQATRFLPLPGPSDELNEDLDRLEAELLAEASVDAAATHRFERFATLRFRRQTSGEEVALPWARFTGDRLSALVDEFVQRYEELFGEGVAHVAAGVELAALRVDLIVPMARPRLASWTDGASAQARPKGERAAWFEGRLHPTRIFEMAGLAPGVELAGPAVIESPLTTVVLPPGAHLRVDPFGNFVIEP